MCKKYIEKMQEHKLSQELIDTFEYYFKQLKSGFTGKINKESVRQPSNEKVIDYNTLETEDFDALKKLVVCKLNGGLGTSMGLKKAKSLLPIKNGLTFLDVIAKQILFLRQKHQCNIPLLLMNSFNTQKDSLNFLAKYNNLQINDIPMDFLQNKFPKVLADSLMPLNEADDSLNWNPPGHGDLYLSLKQSGLLNLLLENGYEYLFVSNSDNLGATVDAKILAWFASQNIPFAMEVCKRTAMDSKGGHLAESKKGNLLLRELAQCPDSEVDDFQDINKWSWFNTNNLWINLKALKTNLEKDSFKLPLIRNQKEVNNKKVYQLETAMGAAIELFDNAKAISVPRTRFVPVKKTNDLLLIWSDCYILTKENELKLNPDCKKQPLIKLDEKYYKNIDQLTERFAGGIPSLVKAEGLEIEGDIHFGKNVEVTGLVKLLTDEEYYIEDTCFEGN